MGMATDMRNLAEEIPASYDARVEWVAALKRETADLMRQIQARQQERNQETVEMMRGFQRENAERAREVENMPAGFRQEMEEMAGHWRTMASTMQRKRAGAK